MTKKVFAYANELIIRSRFGLVAAIIQARIGSSRLPGKIFSELSGKSLLWHIIQRLKNVPSLDMIIIATTAKPEDDKIEDVANEMGVKCFRGDEKDVLSRYIKAAEYYNVDNMVRVTGDSPLICTDTIADMIDLAKNGDFEYVSFHSKPEHVFEGFEFVSLNALRKVINISDENYVREHVTIYIRENPDKFRVGFLPVKNRYLKNRFPVKFKLSVDTKFDLDFMQYIYNKLYKDGSAVDFNHALDLIATDSNLQSLIKLPTHKDIRTSSVRFGFLADKFHNRGLSFAKLLRDYFHYGIYILTSAPDNLVRMAKDEGFNVICIKDSDNIDELRQKNNINFLISYK